MENFTEQDAAQAVFGVRANDILDTLENLEAR